MSERNRVIEVGEAAARLLVKDPEAYARLRNEAVRDAALVRSDESLTPTRRQVEHARIREELHTRILELGSEV